MKYFLMMAGALLGVSAFAVSVPVDQLRPNGHMKNVEIKDGELRSDVTGNDPFMYINNFPKFSAAENQVVKFDLMVGEGSGKNCQLFWITDEDQKYDEKKSINVAIPKFGEWVTIQADLFAKPTWTGTIVGFRFDPVTSVSHKNFAIRNIEFGPFTVKELPMAGWNINEQLKNRKVEDGVLSAELIVGKNDPILGGPAFAALPADKFRYVKFDLSVPEGAGKNAQLFFRTEDMKHFLGNAVANFEVVPDGKFHSYVVDLSGNARWAGKIIQLRIDPTGQVPKDGTVQLRNFRIDTEN